MTLGEIEALARQHSLSVFGAFHPTPEDNAPEGCATLMMFGPYEPGFWAHLTKQPEYHDGTPDPIDRWSTRVIGEIASALCGQALLPFGGPPWHPFIAWAKATGHAWTAPVGILVHDHAGLMVSYRGAVALSAQLALPETGERPCESCADKPCLDACPVGALSANGYDVPRCKNHITDQEGLDCKNGGCLVRRSCPLSQNYERSAAQSAHHMRYFAP